MKGHRNIFNHFSERGYGPIVNYKEISKQEMLTNIHASCLRGKNNNRENMSYEVCVLQNLHYKNECAEKDWIKDGGLRGETSS